MIWPTCLTKTSLPSKIAILADRTNFGGNKPPSPVEVLNDIDGELVNQALYVGNMEQTVPMLAESTGLTFKTVQKAVLRLNQLRLLKRGRRIGNAQTYRFDTGNDLHEMIMWAEHFKFKR